MIHYDDFPFSTTVPGTCKDVTDRGAITSLERFGCFDVVSSRRLRGSSLWRDSVVSVPTLESRKSSSDLSCHSDVLLSPLNSFGSVRGLGPESIPSVPFSRHSWTLWDYYLFSHLLSSLSVCLRDRSRSRFLPSSGRNRNCSGIG